MFAASVAACTWSWGEQHEPPLAQFGAEQRLEAKLLAARSRCAACHAVEVNERVRPLEAPRLDGVGARKSPEGLRRWLSAPHEAKPGTAMPDLLAALPTRERGDVLEALVHFLAAQGGPLRPQEVFVDAGTLESGRQLFHSVGCVACHEPQEARDDLAEPSWDFDPDSALAPNIAADLGAPAFDTSVDALARFLVDPLEVRPSGRMPALHLSEREARSIATYLLRGQIDAQSLAAAPGWSVEYFEFDAAPPDLAQLQAQRSEVVTSLLELSSERREERYAYRIRGFVELERSGQVEFATYTDDGVRLFVDDKLVVDRWHDQAPATHEASLWLERGRHAVELHYFQNLGGAELGLLWKLDGGEQVPIPGDRVSHTAMRLAPPASTFELDARQVERGRAEFARLGCGACHAIEGREPRVSPLRPSPLANLRGALDQGCLSDTPRPRAPHFDFDERERLALRTLLLEPERLSKPREHDEAVHAALTQFDCYACHSRGELGGPDEQREGYFQPTVELDLGNEGRLPPRLDGVGAKLKLDALAHVLESGQGVRPYLATRMPRFGAANVAGLAQHFAALDAGPDADVAPPFEAQHIEQGRKLAGSKGLGCIQCHSFNGVKSLGIPAVDLGVVASRLRPAWFRKLLLDPRSVGMNSRMPILWQERADGSLESPVKDLCGGEPRAQIDALWSYLSLGAGMPLPEGLDTPDLVFELVPGDEPELCAVFLEDSSPRAMMVGFPQGVHYAFDLQDSRLAWVWRGRFFNAKGTWQARAGALERPPVPDARRLSMGAPFARTAKRDEWINSAGEDARYKRLGWRFDAQRAPIWRYSFDGIEIEERIVPRVSGARAALLREFTLRAPAPVEELYFDILERRRVSAWTREGEHFVARFTQEIEL